MDQAMSLDLALQIDTGGPELAEVWSGWNYTHNVGPMYVVTLGTTLGKFLEGKTAEESLPKLREMVAHMEDHPEVYRPLNPENGWGSYETLLPALMELVEAAARHPKASWWVWR